MSKLQRLITSLVPRQWARDMEKESRAWIARCEDCRSERSIWELGGIRWKASGNPRRRIACPRCGSTTWHRIERH